MINITIAIGFLNACQELFSPYHCFHITKLHIISGKVDCKTRILQRLSTYLPQSPNTGPAPAARASLPSSVIP